MLFSSLEKPNKPSVENCLHSSLFNCVRSTLLCFWLGILLTGCPGKENPDTKPRKPTENVPSVSSNPSQDCENPVTAEVVALEQIITFNRFGAFNPAGMVYALKKDVVKDEPGKDGKEINLADLSDSEIAKLAGRVKLKNDKRPRPLVLRVHEDECLQVKFWNLLSPDPIIHDRLKRADYPEGGVTRQSMSVFNVSDLKTEPKPKGEDISTPPRCMDENGKPTGGNCKNLFPFPRQAEPDYPSTRAASIHVNGLDYVPTTPEICKKDGNALGCKGIGNQMGSDGANVGRNPSSLVEPGEHTTYLWYGRQEGGYFMYSAGALAGGEGDGGQLGLGLFGSINVEPKGSVWYRSQVTHDVLVKAANNSENDYSKINYADLAIVDENNMTQHSDLNAIIYQTDKTSETPHVCSKRSPGSSCGMSFREFTTIFHDENKVFQAFKELDDENNPISAIADGMAINYGASGVGSAVLANAKKLGPGKDCPECKLEEFFLSSWVNGDPAMIVRRDLDGKATTALYPDDPSNVHHSYLGDPVRFRNIHAGPKETHVFHLHAHQWLQDKNDPNANYLDSQTISPGSSYTYDIQYGGGGNRNLTVGDAIFHCHLYPHFAAGMWELWRNHDVFEDGKPGLFNASTNERGRYLPDYEIKTGTPNPAIVPIPDYPLAPLPTKDLRGYPFFIAGESGHRPPQPPMDMALKELPTTAKEIEKWQKDKHKWLDGGLPRHIIIAGENEKHDLTDKNDVAELLEGFGDKAATRASRYVAKRTWKLNSDPNNLILAKQVKSATLKILPQCGTKEEILAMAYHAGWDENTILGLKQGKKPEGVNEHIWLACQKEFAQVLGDLPDEVDTNENPNSFPWELKPVNTKWPFHRPIHNDTNPNPQGSTAYMSALWRGKGYERPKAEVPKNHKPSKEVEPGNRFRVNGYSPAQGAPFAEPCPNEYYEDKTNNNKPFAVNRESPRLYKTAYIQFDMTVNKYGWHDPQARMPVLEEDAADTISGERLAEPLFFRANSGDCIEFQATNLIPSVLNLDDFQVYTPTDTIGQHIHLVKFDVTSSDGSANGWNYEDGTFSPDEVRERIYASHADHHGSVQNWDGSDHPELNPKPYHLPGGNSHFNEIGQCESDAEDNLTKHPWCGAQATVQRWWADPVLNHLWEDRTMRAVFTHDHYGPSSHQQHGFYGALVVEPKDSVWAQLDKSPEKVAIVPIQSKDQAASNSKTYTIKNCADSDNHTSAIGGKILGGGAAGQPLTCSNRKDGGPTSYAANIGFADISTNAARKSEVRREYNLAFADFAIVYNADLRPVNPPSRQADLNLPHVVRDGLKPKPEGISAEDPGTRLLNYRNEPIPLRIAEEDSDTLEFHQKIECFDNNQKPPQKLENCTDLAKSGKNILVSTSAVGDMANVFSSVIHDKTKTQDSVDKRIAKLETHVAHEIVDKSELKELLGQQQTKTKTFNENLNKNEPWRHPGDPSTPILAAYEGDPMQLHLIQGAQEEQHVFSINGMDWLAEPKSPNSSFINGQQLGISEHFEFNTVVNISPSILTDYWYGSPAVENMWDGMWGLLRGFGWQKDPEKNREKNKGFIPAKIPDLARLPTSAVQEPPLPHRDALDSVCPSKELRDIYNIPLKTHYVSAWRASDVKELLFNDRFNISDPNAVVFFEVPKSVAVYGYDLKLMSVAAPDNLEATGKNLVVVALVGSKLHIRIFNADGKKIIDKAENILAKSKIDDAIKRTGGKILRNADEILADLNERLPTNGNTSNLTEEDKLYIVEDAVVLSKFPKKNWPSGNAVLSYLKKHKTPIEPMVLRANAGDCIEIEFKNYLPQNTKDVEEMDSNHKHVAYRSQSYNLMPPIVNGFNFNQIQMSNRIGLVPQLVAENVFGSQGSNIGFNHWNCAFADLKNDPDCQENGHIFNRDMRNYHQNLTQGCLIKTKTGVLFDKCDSSIIDTSEPNPKKYDAHYRWYMGSQKVINVADAIGTPCSEEPGSCLDEEIKDKVDSVTGYIRYTPKEFGAVSIRSFGDVIKHSSHSLVGALVVEPKDAKYCTLNQICDASAQAVESHQLSTEAKIYDPNTKEIFREFVLLVQDDLSLQQRSQAMPNHRMADDAEDTGQKGFNFRTEPLWARNGVGTSGADFNELNKVDYSNTLSSIYPNLGCVQGACDDPKTPVFKAKAGDSVRFRIVHPGGHSRQHAFVLYGHNWDYQPWINDSTQLFDNIESHDEETKLMTSRLGAIGGIGPARHVNVLTKAGGKFKVPGDYLFRVQEQFQFQGGLWGIFRVDHN